MKRLQENKGQYFDALRARGKKSRVYRDYQMTGLEIAHLLRDLKHKALYIKLAKIHSKDKLFQLAKSVIENPNVKNPGAYFMRVLANNTNKKGNIAN